MFTALKANSTNIPQIYFAGHVIKEIRRETLQHPQTETGQSLVGVITDNAIFVLGVIPDIVDTTRHAALFQAGGNDQVQIFDWYRRHWDSMRADDSKSQISLWEHVPYGHIPAEFKDLPLSYLGDWHKHPGGMKHLSGTDHNQIVDLLTDRESPMTHLIAPLVTQSYGNKYHVDVDEETGEITLTEMGRQIQIQIYYAHERAPRKIYHVIPKIVNDNYLPALPPLPWHLVYPERLQREIHLLRSIGCNVRWMIKEKGGDPDIMEILFGIDHPNWHTKLIVVTPYNYPHGNVEVVRYPKSDSSTIAPNANSSASVTFTWFEKAKEIVGKVFPKGKPRNTRAPHLADLVRDMWSELAIEVEAEGTDEEVEVIEASETEEQMPSEVPSDSVDEILVTHEEEVEPTDSETAEEISYVVADEHPELEGEEE